MHRHLNILAKFFRDKDGKVVLWQTPNMPLMGWALFLAISHLSPFDKWQIAAEYISFGFLFTWAWLEISNGATYFRRLLGLLVLIISIISRIN